MSLDREMQHRITAVERRIQDQASLMDGVERELDDIADEKVRRRLRQIIERYDEARDGIRHEVGAILTHDLFDQLRILATDVRHEL
jgi:hypothetical protein